MDVSLCETQSIARAQATVFGVCAAALLNEPTPSLVEDIEKVSHTLGDGCFEGLVDGGDLSQCYYDRFFVPVSPYYVPLVESCVMQRRQTENGWELGSCDGPSADHVLRCYKIVGFDWRELEGCALAVQTAKPDSLAIEAAFVAFLKKAESQAEKADCESIGQLCDEFVRLHPARWAGDAAMLMEQKGDDFYVRTVRLLAKLFEAFAN